jgi:ABC-type glycerol-3-phosphate transport system substrate-binding protein
MRSGRLGFFILIALFLVATVTHAQDTTILQIGAESFAADLVYTDDLLARFEAEHPGVQVNVVQIDPDDYNAASSATTIDEYIQAVQEFASAADVLTVQSSHIQPLATRAHVYLDLSPLVSADTSLNVDDFYASTWQSYQWDGGIWGIPSTFNPLMFSYDPAAFDAAGLTYPDANWTMDDIDRAARALAQYNDDGTVSQVGLTLYDSNAFINIARSLLGHGFYDSSTQPETPSLNSPELQAIMTTWAQLVADGVVGFGQGVFGGDDSSQPPFGFGGSFMFFTGFGPQNGDGNTAQQNQPLEAAPLPGGNIVVTTNGYAVSAGTQYPELAYELAKWLTSQPEVTNGSFNNGIPARRSLDGVQPQQNDDGGGGRAIAIAIGGGQLPENVRPIIEPLLDTAISEGEMRYSYYVQQALDSMISDELDAETALQTSEAQAVSDAQIASDTQSTIIVADPVLPPVLAAGEVSLNFGLSEPRFAQGNTDAWDAVIADFVASDPQVGAVNLSDGFGQDISTTDCYYQSFNDVPNIDLSTILSLDPYLDADPNFNRDDIVNGILSQVQRDGMTWAIPMTLQPGVLQYDATQFQNAGAFEPAEGWTVDEFEAALNALYANNPDAAPFASAGGGGLYMLELIAAYGGLPIDFRTNPPTIDFTSESSVNAIRQVLDLAKAGLIQYEQTGGFGIVTFGGGPRTDAIYPESFFGFFGGPVGEQQENPYRMTTFPSGTDYTPLSLEVGTAYINATTQNPDACYRFIMELSQHPELFSGMPARYSVLNDPAYTSTQSADVLETYSRIAELATQPNTIIFPSLRGGNIENFLVQYWLNQAMDNYVLNDADLETELSDAQQHATAYQECIVGIPPFDPAQGSREEYVGQIQQCATLADPDLTSLFPGG